MSDFLLSSIKAFIVRGFGAISLFIMNLIVARMLPLEEAGYFLLAFAVVMVLAPSGLVGLQQTSLRFIGIAFANENWSEVNAFVQVSRVWALLGTLTLSLVLWFLAPIISDVLFEKPELRQVLRLISPAVLFFGLVLLYSSYLQALRKVSQAIFLLSIGVPLGVSAGVYLLAPDTATQVVNIYVAASLMTLFIGLFWWKKYSKNAVLTTFDHKVILNSCLPLWVVVLMNLLVQWGSHFIAGVYVSVEEVAFLSIALRTANLVSFILIAVNIVLAPRFAALYAQEKSNELRRLAFSSVRIMLFFSAPVVSLLCIFPEFFMKLFGEEYVAAAPLLIILSLGQFVNVVTGSVGILLTMSGHERDMRNILMFSALTAIFLAIILTDIWGVWGAALATAISVSLQNLGAVWLVKKRLGFNMLAIWIKT